MKRAVCILRIAILCLLVAISAPTEAVDQCISKTYETGDNGGERTITAQNGQYVIQVITRLSTSQDGCNSVNRVGLVDSFAVKYAIDRINSIDTLMPNATLGYLMDTSCTDLPTTMARGIETTALFRPNSVCRKNFKECSKSSDTKGVTAMPISAVLGTRMSFTTIPLASLLGLYKIPQISPSASSRLLSKPEFKSFFRTIPSDSNQAQAMLDIIKDFGWNYVFAVGSNDDYGKLSIADIKAKAHSLNICIPYDEYIPHTGEEMIKKVRDVVLKINATKNAEVVILFCYADSIGREIFKEAHRIGLKRVWLTSEAFNPTALTIDAPISQVEGILTVSLKSADMSKMCDYARELILRDYKCDLWLSKFIKQSLQCSVESVSKNKKIFYGNNCSSSGPCQRCKVRVDTVVEKVLYPLPGTLDLVVDSVFAIAHGIHKVLQKTCPKAGCSSPTFIEPNALSAALREVAFVNEHGREVAFNQSGDALHPYYNIENVQLVDGKLQYVKVGDWVLDRKDSIKLDKDAIKWPHGVLQPPRSVCHEKCQPGYRYIAKTMCCWDCKKCEKNTYSNETMSKRCSSCPAGYHTPDQKNCFRTKIRHLSIENNAGISVIATNCFGLLLVLISFGFLIFFWRSGTLVNDSNSPKNEESPWGFIAITLLYASFSFIYGLLLTQTPDEKWCLARNGYFFQLFAFFSSLLVVKTNLMSSILSHYLVPVVDHLFFARVIFIFIFFLVELITVIIFLYLRPINVTQFTFPGEFDIWLQCNNDFTSSRILIVSIPVIFLLIATIQAFRERGIQTSFHDAKFLNFACIASCLVTLAFLPTYKYVVGFYKDIVVAFIADLIAFILIGCLVLPKFYEAIYHGLNKNSDKYDIKGSTEMTRYLRTVSAITNSADVSATDSPLSPRTPNTSLLDVKQ